MERYSLLLFLSRDNNRSNEYLSIGTEKYQPILKRGEDFLVPKGAVKSMSVLSPVLSPSIKVTSPSPTPSPTQPLSTTVSSSSSALLFRDVIGTPMRGTGDFPLSVGVSGRDEKKKNDPLHLGTGQNQVQGPGQGLGQGPGQGPLQGPRFADFLRLYHSALVAASVSPLFLTRSTGILHIPFLLPKHKSKKIRSQIIEKVLLSYQSLRNPLAESYCEPLFLESDAPRVPENLTIPVIRSGKFNSESKSDNFDGGGGEYGQQVGVKDKEVDKEREKEREKEKDKLKENGKENGKEKEKGNEKERESKVLMRRIIAPVQWCETSSNYSLGEGNSTLFGVNNLTSVSTPLSLTSNSSLSPFGKRSDNYMKRPDQDDYLHTCSVSTILSTNGPSQGSTQETKEKERDRPRTNSNDSRVRDRNNSFTPPYIPSSSSPFPSTTTTNLPGAGSGTGAGTGGDLRFLLDYDSVIASTLPLWLRRRGFALEISVSTDGIFIFYFNVSPTLINAVCEISASTAAAGLRSHNEEIRDQLVILGILKQKILSPLKVQELSVRTEEGSTFPASSSMSPMKSGISFSSGSSSSPFPHSSVSQVVVVASASVNVSVGGIASVGVGGVGMIQSPGSSAISSGNSGISTGIGEIKNKILFK